MHGRAVVYLCDCKKIYLNKVYIGSYVVYFYIVISNVLILNALDFSKVLLVDIMHICFFYNLKMV